MLVLLYTLFFLLSFIAIALASRSSVDALSKIARFLGWKEFIVAFLTIALGVSLPNLTVGILSALKKIPELSFGDVIGGNIVNLTLVAALSTFFSKAGLSAPSRTVQGSAKFTLLIAILPLILGLDGVLSWNDGLILLSVFFLYLSWLFAKKERFLKSYDGQEIKSREAFSNFGILIFSVILLIGGAKGIVSASQFFVKTFGFSLEKIGILIVGLGNAFPETFFSIEAAKKNQDWLILGDLMGSVVITATLVLGIVSLISPIYIKDISPILISRFFLFFAALFFVISIRSGHKITKKEGLVLLSIYIIFLIFQFFL